MRYYSLVVSDPASGLVWKPSSNGLGFTKSAGGSTFTSFVNGMTDPGALNIEADMPVSAWNQSQGRQWIRVWGIGLPMLAYAANLNGANVTLSAGMQAGLPLATATKGQAGVILQGTVFQSFGNWQGTEQTLELVTNPSAESVGNIGFNWPAGTSLSQAITVSLAQAFSPPNSPVKYTPNVNIGANLMRADTQPGTYPNLYAFASYLNEISLQTGRQIYGNSYAGVQINIVGNTINVYDGQGAQPAKVIQLAFQDLIGQPTWISATQVSFKTVLRSDIGLGMQVKFPPSIASPYALTSAGAATPNAPVSNKISFQKPFIVNDAHHYMNARQPDAESWNTTFTASAVSAS
jgi:hypothetical protein